MKRFAVLSLTCAAMAAVAVPALYNAVNAQEASTPDGQMGKAVYEKWCAPCHDPGTHHPGTSALTVKYKGEKPGVILEWDDLTPEYVEYIVRTGISVMPQFRKTEISDAELKALAEYAANAANE